MTKQEIATAKIAKIFSNKILPILEKYQITEIAISGVCEHCGTTTIIEIQQVERRDLN